MLTIPTPKSAAPTGESGPTPLGETSWLDSIGGPWHHGGSKPGPKDRASEGSSLGALDSPNLVARLSWLDALGEAWHEGGSTPLDGAPARRQRGITAQAVQLLGACHTAAASQPLATQAEHATLQVEHATRLQCVCGARYAEGMPYLERGEQACHFCVGDEAGQPAGLLLGRAVGINHVAVRFDQGGGSYSWVHPRVYSLLVVPPLAAWGPHGY